MSGHAPGKDPQKQPSPPEDELLEEGLKESFPASDPPTAAQPHEHYWNEHPETD